MADPIRSEPGLVEPKAATEPSVVEVHGLDWAAIRHAVEPRALRGRTVQTVEHLESLLDQPHGPGLLFDADRAHDSDRAIQVSAGVASAPLWIIGDLHGDLLALEACLAHIREQTGGEGAADARIVFLGDFIDDEGLALEVLLRVYELIAENPGRICVVAGNHDEALALEGDRFTSSVSPSDFADHLNAHRGDEWAQRVGKLVIRLTAHAPRALFFPDGLLVSHGGFPLTDLHASLEQTGDFNAAPCLSDFVWVRMHPKARRKLPNRFTRGSQFGYEDFADFCALCARLGRPVTHLVRGHDHAEARYAIHPAYAAHPVLTTVALSRRLPREQFGPYERTPTLARVLPGAPPEVHVLHLPPELIHEVFPPAELSLLAGSEATETPPR